MENCSRQRESTKISNVFKEQKLLLLKYCQKPRYVFTLSLLPKGSSYFIRIALQITGDLLSQLGWREFKYRLLKTPQICFPTDICSFYLKQPWRNKSWGVIELKINFIKLNFSGMGKTSHFFYSPQVNTSEEEF